MGNLAQASLATSSRFFEPGTTVWSNTTIDLAAATLSVRVTKRREP